MSTAYIDKDRKGNNPSKSYFNISGTKKTSCQ